MSDNSLQTPAHIQPLTSPLRWLRSRTMASAHAERGAGRRHVAARPTILAVDDEPDALDFLRAFLSGEYDFMQAASGPQALTLIAERRPDLCIIDVMMPGMTGLELCDMLRERAETRDIPIILYSAHDMQQHSNTGLYDHAFVKPADPDQLLWAIRVLLPEAG